MNPSKIQENSGTEAVYMTEEFTSFHYIFFYSSKYNLSFYCDDILVGLDNSREQTFMVERGKGLYNEWKNWLENNLDWLRPNKIKFNLTKKHIRDLTRFLQESAISEKRATNQIVNEDFNNPAKRLLAIDKEIHNLYRKNRK